MPRVHCSVGCRLPLRALSCLHVHADLWLAETGTSTDTIKSGVLAPELMYTEDQIRKAADGESAGAGGLNLPDIKKILTASGLSIGGYGEEVRARLKENLANCLTCQGFTAPSGAGSLCAHCHACMCIRTSTPTQPQTCPDAQAHPSGDPHRRSLTQRRQ